MLELVAKDDQGEKIPSPKRKMLPPINNYEHYNIPSIISLYIYILK
jgi:hypothetical protein